MEKDLINRITTDPSVMTGKPVIRGMRITMDQILKALSNGRSFDEIKSEYPELEDDDIRAAKLLSSN